MSNVKNFSIQGVAHDVQFGKGGGRIVFKDGQFHVVSTQTGDDLSRLKIADPKEQSDAVTLSAMTGAIGVVNTKIDNSTGALASQVTSVLSTVSSLQAEVANVKLDTIVSADGTHSLTSANGVLAFGGTDNASFNIALSKSEVALSATTTEVPDTNLRLVPQGAGSVIIGDGTQDGLIQPEGGHSLTIAGGDADQGGNVVIRAGHGTTPGHVEVHDLIDPVADRDAVTLAFSNAALTKAASMIVSNSLRAVIGSFSETNGDVEVVKIAAGSLLRLKVLILSSFATGATITVRTSTSTLATSAVIDESQPGIYVIELLQDTKADAITVAMTTPGGTGSAALSLEYIAA